MPQPLKPEQSGNLKMLWDAQALTQRPKLASHIGVIAAMWTEVEVNIGHILSAMCGIQYNVATAIYVALVSAGPRTEVLNTIAKARLPKRARKDLELLLREYRTRSAERNRIVHGRWGISGEDAECLLYQDPDEHTMMIAEAVFGWGSNRPFRKFRRKVTIHRYREADFLATEQRILKLKQDTWSFSARLRDKRLHERFIRRLRSPPSRKQIEAAFPGLLGKPPSRKQIHAALATALLGTYGATDK